MEKIKPGFILIVSMVLAAAFSRLIPHWPNFTAVAAIALFGGARFSNRIVAFIIPLAALFLTDLILGFHSTMIPVYVAFSITVALGMTLRNKTSVLGVSMMAVSASVIFFLITNFGSWLTMPMYAKDGSGLMMAYLNGLAFFHNGSMGISPFLNTLLGDLFFSGLLFGSWAWASRRIPLLKMA
jgi:hypothetical protein